MKEEMIRKLCDKTLYPDYLYKHIMSFSNACGNVADNIFYEADLSEQVLDYAEDTILKNRDSLSRDEILILNWIKEHRRDCHKFAVGKREIQKELEDALADMKVKLEDAMILCENAENAVYDIFEELQEQ